MFRNQGILYNIENKVPLTESVYRFGSDAYFNMWNEARQLYNKGLLEDLDGFDEEVLRDTQLGEWVNIKGVGKVPLDMIIDEENHALAEAEYQGKQVDLNKPKRGGSKKFVVKACKNGKEKIVRFGDPNMRIKKSNPKRRKSFRARHKCDQKKDKFSAGYWSCKKW